MNEKVNKNSLNKATSRIRCGSSPLSRALYILPFLVVAVPLLVCLWGFIDGVIISGPGLDSVIILKRIMRKFIKSFSDPIVYVSLCVLLLLQLKFPANKKQKLFGSHTTIDLLYIVFMTIFYATIGYAFIKFLKVSFHQYVKPEDLYMAIYFPRWAQLLLGYLMIDFLGWFHHLMRHKIPVFWEFHVIHHSQDKMNVFTNERVHFFDWYAAQVIKFIPAFLFIDTFQIVLAYVVFHRFQDCLVHSNVKTNLGILKYIFVTPQSHHIHHSREVEHYDKNFGVSLSIWDYIFGTQYKDYEVYPETGVSDEDFPMEKEGSDFFELLKTLGKQTAYPFVKIAKITFGSR